MKPEIAKKWVEALRSGQYEQGYDLLRSRNAITGKEQYCVLGVLCDLAVKDGVPIVADDDFGCGYEWNNGFGTHREVEVLPPPVVEWAGFPEGCLTPAVYDGERFYIRLSELNDDNRLSFLDIADLIERDWADPASDRLIEQSSN